MLMSALQSSCQITLQSMCLCVYGEGCQFLLWGCLFLVSCLQWLQGGREPKEAERNSSLGVTGWVAPQGRASRWRAVNGGLVPRSIPEQNPKVNVLRRQREPCVMPGPQPSTQRHHHVCRSRTCTDVSGQGAGQALK